MKKAKITIEYDGRKTVWEADQFEMHQNRDVKRDPDPDRPGKVKLIPGDTVMVIVAFRPELNKEESSPPLTADDIRRKVAEVKTANNDAQAIQESRRDMAKESDPASTKEALSRAVSKEVEERIDKPVSESLEKLSKASAEYMIGRLETDWDEFLKQAAAGVTATERLVDKVIGNWQFLKFDLRGRMFEMRVKNTKTGVVINVRESMDYWKERGILDTINEKARREGIVV